MPKGRKKPACIGISTGIQLLQSSIDIPASKSVRH